MKQTNVVKFPSEDYCKQNCKLLTDHADGWCSHVYNTIGYALDEKCPKVATFIDNVADDTRIFEKWHKPILKRGE